MKPIFDNTDIRSSHSDRVIATPSKFAKKALFYVQETGRLRSLAPHISKRENMDSYLFIHVLSGEGYFSYKNERTHVTSGACFFIDCMQPYSHESTSDHPWELQWVHFNGSSIREYYQYFSRNTPHIFYLQDLGPINALLVQLLEIQKERPPYYEVISSSLLVQLITSLITVPKKAGSHISTAADPMDKKLSEVHQYLNQNYQHSINLDQLASLFYISKYYLCREFKKKYGEGIPSYLTNKRVTHAKELLRFSSMSIQEIASACGISDSNYFIRQFKASEGLTPSAYRKKWVS